MANGLLDLLGGLGTKPPAYLEGLLGAQQTEDLRKQSIGTGLANALVGYLAMPKNQNLGLGRILAGAAQAGIGGAQGVYDTATQDYMQAQKIAEMQRAKEQREARELAISQLPAEQQALYRAYGEAAVPKLVEAAMPKQRERKTATVNNVVIDTDTGLPIYTGEKELKAPPTRERQVGRTKIIEEMQADGTFKEIGRGSMDAPEKAEKLSYKVETGADGNIYYVPTKPNNPILDVTGKPTNAYKPAGAKPTEDQSKAAGWLNQTQNAYNNMKKVMYKKDDQGNQVLNYDVIQPSAVEAIAGIGGGKLKGATQSADRQRFVQATESMSEALLRAATGAGQNENEVKQKIRELTPEYFDKPEVIQQKLEAIPVYIESLKTRANIKTTPSQTPARSKSDILKQYGVDNG